MASDARGHFYGSPWLDRSAHLRRDTTWIDKRLESPDTFLLPSWNGRSLMQLQEAPSAVFLRCHEVPGDALADSLPVLLGRDRSDAAWFALLFDGEQGPVELGPREARFASLKRTGPLLARSDAGVLAFTRAMSNWHSTHRYCGTCGAPTEPLEAGWLRRCTLETCGRQHFPRTDPAVIMRVTHGDRIILLGRQAAWPERWYSVLAGFVEPGESLEDAVCREVLEEVGLVVSNVRYDGSQPWPFPQSLMLGFSAEADTDKIVCDSEELEDARWFSREEIEAGHESGQLRLSPKVSISRHLIDQWLGSQE